MVLRFSWPISSGLQVWLNGLVISWTNILWAGSWTMLLSLQRWRSSTMNNEVMGPPVPQNVSSGIDHFLTVSPAAPAWSVKLRDLCDPRPFSHPRGWRTAGPQRKRAKLNELLKRFPDSTSEITSERGWGQSRTAKATALCLSELKGRNQGPRLRRKIPEVQKRVGPQDTHCLREGLGLRPEKQSNG